MELVVSNNGSTDGTAGYLDSLDVQARVRVYHQPVNLGATLHVGWLYGQARGTFLWMIGDDDMIEPDLVEIVCDTLRRNPALGWILLPHRFPQGPVPVASPCPAVPEFHASSRELFPSWLLWMTFVTANVIRTRSTQAVLPRLRFDTSYWPMTMLMMAVADQPAAVLNVCKIEGGSEITWADEAQVISNIQLPHAILNCAVLSNSEKRACLRRRYTAQPEYLDRLTWLRPGLLLRIFWVAPQLCNPAFFARVVRKVCRRLFTSRSLARANGTAPPA